MTVYGRVPDPCHSVDQVVNNGVSSWMVVIGNQDCHPCPSSPLEWSFRSLVWSEPGTHRVRVNLKSTCDSLPVFYPHELEEVGYEVLPAAMCGADVACLAPSWVRAGDPECDLSMEERQPETLDRSHSGSP